MDTGFDNKDIEANNQKAMDLQNRAVFEGNASTILCAASWIFIDRRNRGGLTSNLWTTTILASVALAAKSLWDVGKARQLHNSAGKAVRLGSALDTWSERVLPRKLPEQGRSNARE